MISSRTSDELYGHSASLAMLIQQILYAEQIRVADLSAVSVSIGPGSYTGLRVGLSTAKALCHASGCHLITSSTLESLAYTTATLNKNPVSRIIPVLDARRQDAYTAVFDGLGHRLREDRCITVSPDCLDACLGGVDTAMICGEGIDKWRDHFGQRPGFELVPMECHASNLVGCGWKSFKKQEFADVTSSVPRYLKPPNISMSRK